MSDAELMDYERWHVRTRSVRPVYRVKAICIRTGEAAVAGSGPGAQPGTTESNPIPEFLLRKNAKAPYERERAAT